MDLVIRNGTVVTAGEISQADVGIEAGLVKQIGQVGQQVTGWPTHTLSRGEVIVENGHVLGNAGRGKLLKRKRFTPL